MDANGMDARRVSALDRLTLEEEPSPALERRVTAALRREGLLRDRRRIPWLPRVAAAVVATALFAGGWLTGFLSDRPQPVDDPTLTTAALQPTHLLLLRTGAGYRPAPTPEAARERVAEYRAWARREALAGRLPGGYRLGHHIELLTVGGKAQNASDVQGLFLVVADDMDAAVGIAYGSPHTRYGGTVEVRAIDGT